MGGVVSRKTPQSTENAQLQNLSVVEAAAAGDIAELARLLDLSPGSVNACDYDLRSPMHLACAEGHLNAVKFLMANGAHACIKDRWGHEPLQEAILYGHNSVANYLLDAGVTLSQLSRDSFENLIISLASQGDLSRIQLLVQSGVSINAVNCERCTALHNAASSGHETIVEYLIAHQADVHAKDTKGFTAMDCAIKCRHSAVQAVLRAAGVEGGGGEDISPVLSKKMFLTRQKAFVASTPASFPTNFEKSKEKKSTKSNAMTRKLIDAAAKGDVKDLAKVLTLGATVQDCDYDSRSCLHLACAEGRIKAVKYLIGKNAKLDASDRWGHVPLQDAMENGHKTVVAELVHAGASLPVKNRLELAARVCSLADQGDLRHLASLVDCGISANAVDSTGRTPLILAASAGHLAVVKYLLSKGADPRRKGPGGSSALSAARQAGHSSVAAALEHAGAEGPDAPQHSGGNPRDRHAAEAVYRGLLCGAQLEAVPGCTSPEPTGRCASILFIDVVGFAGTAGPGDVSAALARLFERLDNLAILRGVQRLGVIGDSYLAATNLAHDQDDHAARMASFALEAIITAEVDDADQCKIEPVAHIKCIPGSGVRVKIRAGMHCGHVGVFRSHDKNLEDKERRVGMITAATVETVDTASVLATRSLPGRIQCSAAFAVALAQQAPDIHVQQRDLTVQRFGMDEIAAYWVQGCTAQKRKTGASRWPHGVREAQPSLEVLQTHSESAQLSRPPKACPSVRPPGILRSSPKHSDNSSASLVLKMQSQSGRSGSTSPICAARS